MSYHDQGSYFDYKYDGNWFTGIYKSSDGRWVVDQIYFDGPGCAGFVTDTMYFNTFDEAAVYIK